MKNKTESNLKEWKIKEINKLCNFFVEEKYCHKCEDRLEQYQKFFEKVCYLNDHREYVIRDMITKSPGLRTYLQIHSASIVIVDEDDWLSILMKDILRITDEDIESVKNAEFVPQDILKKLEMFDPEPEGFEKENIRIEYDFYGFGGPIRIIDTDWEDLDRKTVDVKSFLSQYSHIEPEIKSPNGYTDEEMKRFDEDLGIAF
jgi:hypothetical protein